MAQILIHIDDELLSEDDAGDLATYLAEVVSELIRATAAFPIMKSYHEGHAILREEFEELWDEIKCKHPDDVKIRKEAIQVAAMALRFLGDLT